MDHTRRLLLLPLWADGNWFVMFFFFKLLLLVFFFLSLFLFLFGGIQTFPDYVFYPG